MPAQRKKVRKFIPQASDDGSRDQKCLTNVLVTRLWLTKTKFLYLVVPAIEMKECQQKVYIIIDFRTDNILVNHLLKQCMTRMLATILKLSNFQSPWEVVGELANPIRMKFIALQSGNEAFIYGGKCEKASGTTGKTWEACDPMAEIFNFETGLATNFTGTL